MPVHTVNELKLSLGIVKAQHILDLAIDEAEKDWKPEWQMALNQLRVDLKISWLLNRFYLNATWILRPTALANFSSVESRMSVA